MRKWFWSSGGEGAATAGLQQHSFTPDLLAEADKLCCTTNLSKVSKVMIPPVPSRFTVIAAIDKPANFGQCQHAVTHTSCICFRAHAAVTSSTFVKKVKLKPLVKFNP